MRDSGQADQTDAVSWLLQERLGEVARLLEETANKAGGRGGKYNKLLKAASVDEDYLKVAYIGTQCAFQTLITKTTTKGQNTVLKVCRRIASRLEADMKCQLFEALHPAYYNTVFRSLKEQNVLDYTHKHKVMMKKFNEFEIEWNDWTPVMEAQIGQRVLVAILTAFFDVLYIRKDWSRGKSVARLDSTVLFDDWAAEFEKERGFMNPTMLPLKAPPIAWSVESPYGGYHTAGMCKRFPFVKTRGKAHKEFVAANPPIAHMSAANKMQATSWEINRPVLAVQRIIYENGLEIGMPNSQQITPPEFPAHLKDVAKEDLTKDNKEEISDWKVRAKAAYGRERTRKGKVLAFMQTHKLANELSEWDKFYFAYNCDFRGRIYCATSGLSPQGADTAKGLLRFHNGVQLGTSGVKWLAVHGANTYGEDKGSFDDRREFIEKHEQAIRFVVEDPINAREFWGAADKPYQFLAFCFDWAACDYGRDATAKSYIPVGLDGSCNGLQHYSAMLRDPVGAVGTNLIDGDVPEDLYQRVADVCTQKLQSMDDPLAAVWLRVGVGRKCAKRPVMTLPYGSTQQSARTYILEYVEDNWAAFKLPEEMQWEMAKFLTPILWTSIGEVVVAARQAMSWLQKQVGSDYAHWVTPIGFPVYQYYKAVDPVYIRTKLNGNMQLWMRDVDQDGGPNAVGQRNGIAPNFVHSLDSTHMVMVINSCDLWDMAMIHDDFGTHAGAIDKLYVTIREEFLKLYTNNDPLVDWAEQVDADLDSLPETGDYDINQIIQAKYFFS
tara:strand:+ start:2560 stop:4893 length:2334 start_codon:yes stop_codon:yes gene_type:complete